MLPPPLNSAQSIDVRALSKKDTLAHASVDWVESFEVLVVHFEAEGFGVMWAKRNVAQREFVVPKGLAPWREKR